MEPVNYKISPQLQSIFQKNNLLLLNKGLAHTYLDKIEKLIPSIHSDYAHIFSYGFGSSLFSSLNLIKYLKELLPNLKDPNLAEAVGSWVHEEEAYLKYADLLDTWRAREDVVAFILAREGKGPDKRPPEVIFNVSEDKIEKLAFSLIRDMDALEVGRRLKMLGGTSIHETRFSIERVSLDRFHIIYYDTGSDTELHLNVPHLKVQEWMALLKLKLTSNEPNDVVAYLLTLDPKAVDLRKTTKQKTNSCPSQALLADLKQHVEKIAGVEAFKTLKKALIEYSLVQEKGKIDPVVEKHLKYKAKTVGQTREVKAEVKLQVFEDGFDEWIRSKSWYQRFFNWSRHFAETDWKAYLEAYFTFAPKAKIIDRLLTLSKEGLLTDELLDRIFEKFKDDFEFLCAIKSISAGTRHALIFEAIEKPEKGAIHSLDNLQIYNILTKVISQENLISFLRKIPPGKKTDMIISIAFFYFHRIMFEEYFHGKVDCNTALSLNHRIFIIARQPDLFEAVWPQLNFFDFDPSFLQYDDLDRLKLTPKIVIKKIKSEMKKNYIGSNGKMNLALYALERLNLDDPEREFLNDIANPPQNKMGPFKGYLA